jgi:two-component system, OmpR family, sensor kinase
MSERLVQKQSTWETTTAQVRVTVLAHDMRNHLTPLRMRLDLIRRRAMREGRGDYLRDSEDAAKTVRRLSRLIDDLLDVSRLERGLFLIESRPIDVAALVREAAEAFEIGEATIEVLLPGQAIAWADPDRLRQAVENLLANAVGQSPPSSVIQIEVFETIREKQTWRAVRVSDHGPGIPPGLLPRLFECFSTGPGSVGLGLGLYLAQGIAVAHGGPLSVNSELGQGASFILTWPSQSMEARRHASQSVDRGAS